MRSSFFCVSIFCQLLLRGQGFSLQNCHLCFLQIYFHQIILSLLDEPKQPNSPTFPAPTHNKKIMLSYTFIRVTHKHESIMSFKYFHISNPSKNIRPQWGFPTPPNCPRHMVPTPMGLSLLAAFEELDPQ